MQAACCTYSGCTLCFQIFCWHPYCVSLSLHSHSYYLSVRASDGIYKGFAVHPCAPMHCVWPCIPFFLTAYECTINFCTSFGAVLGLQHVQQYMLKRHVLPSLDYTTACTARSLCFECVSLYLGMHHVEGCSFTFWSVSSFQTSGQRWRQCTKFRIGFTGGEFEGSGHLNSAELDKWGFPEDMFEWSCEGWSKLRCFIPPHFQQSGCNNHRTGDNPWRNSTA